MPPSMAEQVAWRRSGRWQQATSSKNCFWYRGSLPWCGVVNHAFCGLYEIKTFSERIPGACNILEFPKKRQTRPANSCGISRASHWCPLRLRYRFHHRSLLQTLCVWLPLASTSCPTVELGEQFLRRVGFAQFYRESTKKDQTTGFRTKWNRKRHFHAVETEPKRSTLLLARQRLAPWLLHCCHLSTMPDIGFIGISRLWLCLMQQLVEFGFRKWNCFDTLVVLLQWADYAAEMMPGKLVQSGNLGILSLHSIFLLVPVCWSIQLFIIFYRFNLLVALYVCTYERCTYRESTSPAQRSRYLRNVFAPASFGAYHAPGSRYSLDGGVAHHGSFDCCSSEELSNYWRWVEFGSTTRGLCSMSTHAGSVVLQCFATHFENVWLLLSDLARPVYGLWFGPQFFLAC